MEQADYIVGSIGILLNFISIFPQLYKSYFKREVESLSKKSLFMTVITLSTWSGYGAFKKDYLLMSNYIMTSLMFSIILICKYKFNPPKDISDSKI